MTNVEGYQKTHNWYVQPYGGVVTPAKVLAQKSRCGFYGKVAYTPIAKSTFGVEFNLARDFPESSRESSDFSVRIIWSY